MKYVIDSKTYENHIRDEVQLYGLLHQLAFLAGKVEDDEDVEDLIEMARRYGETAEEKFREWRIPGRYLVFGDRADLAERKAAELVPLAVVLKEHERERLEKERAAALRDPAYIISGGSFRLLVSDLFTLLGQYGFLRSRVRELETEAQLKRLQKKLSKENAAVRRIYRGWGIPDGECVTCSDMMEKAIGHTHLKPYGPGGAADGCEGYDPSGDEYE